MRNTRKLLLLAFGLIAAMALVPSVASAQNVELERESGGDCPAVTAVGHLPSALGGCTIHAVTEPGTTADLYQHVAGVGEVPFSQCSNEFEATFNAAGVGFIYNQVLTPEGGACGREVCDEAEGQPNPHRNIEWAARISEPTATSGERINVTFCLYQHSAVATSEGTTGTPCQVDLATSRVGHAYEVRTLPINPALNQHGSPCINLGGAVELVGHWVSSPSTPRHRGFMVHHLN